MSHQRAAAAWADGKFDDETRPVAVPQKTRRAGHLRPRRGRARRRHRRKPGGAEAPGEGRRGHRRQRQPAERRRRRLPGGRRGRARALWASSRWAGWSAGRPPAAILRGWASARCRPWSGSSPAPAWAGTTSTSSSSTRPSRRRCWRCSRAGAGTIATGSTSTARASRSAIRSARPAGGSWPICCAS